MPLHKQCKCRNQFLSENFSLHEIRCPDMGTKSRQHNGRARFGDAACNRADKPSDRLAIDARKDKCSNFGTAKRSKKMEVSLSFSDSMALAWNCCECGYFPNYFGLSDHCQECHHHFCTECKLICRINSQAGSGSHSQRLVTQPFQRQNQDAYRSPYSPVSLIRYRATARVFSTTTNVSTEVSTGSRFSSISQKRSPGPRALAEVSYDTTRPPGDPQPNWMEVLKKLETETVRRTRCHVHC